MKADSKIQDEAIIWASEKITELLQKGNMNAKLTEELEGEIRSKVNPQYKDRIGTESYERDALLQEIDILRAAIKQTYDDNANLDEQNN